MNLFILLGSTMYQCKTGLQVTIGISIAYSYCYNHTALHLRLIGQNSESSLCFYFKATFQLQR